MKNLILFFLFLIGFYAFAQEGCQYIVKVNADGLKETGKIRLFIQNTGKETFKVSEKLNFCNIRLADLESFNQDTQSFEKLNISQKDIDCFKYQDKSKSLKPDKAYTYIIDIKSDFEILLNKSFFDVFRNKRYRFKISFALDSYKLCRKSNTLITDWIYKN